MPQPYFRSEAVRPSQIVSPAPPFNTFSQHRTDWW